MSTSDNGWTTVGTDTELNGVPKADFTTEYAVAAAINGLTRLKTEAHFAGWEQDFLDTDYGVAVIEALSDKVKTLEQGRKGLDADWIGLEQEVKEGRKTITQLQTAGEKADTELMELRLEVKRLKHELGVAKYDLGQAQAGLVRHFCIIENLSATLDKVTAH